MFSKKQRLTTKEFDVVFSSGQAFFTKDFILKFKSGDTNKFAVVVPKKIIKGAFKRNTLRRRIYHTLKDVASFNKTGSFVLITRNNLLDLKKEDLEEKIKETFSKLA